MTSRSPSRPTGMAKSGKGRPGRPDRGRPAQVGPRYRQASGAKSESRTRRANTAGSQAARTTAPRVVGGQDILVAIAINRFAGNTKTPVGPSGRMAAAVALRRPGWQHRAGGRAVACAGRARRPPWSSPPAHAADPPAAVGAGELPEIEAVDRVAAAYRAYRQRPRQVAIRPAPRHPPPDRPPRPRARAGRRGEGSRVR